MLERLGPYRILRQLGRGGMGTVYEGVDLATGQPAAVKLLSAELARHAGFRDRFEAEIEALRKLHHPNIVQLLGFGQQDEQWFYAMELVSGSSLEELLSRGRTFDFREAAQIGIDTCRALRHAHDRGIIHRDIKPGNLLLELDGHVKLSDFGIARLFGNLRGPGLGGVVGTAEYMAPEQAEGRAVDPRTDLYSLGCVLFSLLARRPPFQGQSLGEILRKQRTEPPPSLLDFARDIPLELAEIIAQLLEKDPHRRIPNATLLGRRLELMLLALRVDPEAEPRGAAADEGGPPETIEARRASEGCGAGPLVDAADFPGAAEKAVCTPEHAVSQQLPSGGPTRPDSLVGDELPSPAAEVPMTQPAEAVQDRPAAPPPVVPRPASRFVPVRPGDLDAPALPQNSTAWISPQTWALAGGLLIVGLITWYLLQPLSADALYQRIAVRTQDGSRDALLECEDQIRDFLLRFPGDPRGEELRADARQIDLLRLERKLELRANGLSSGWGLAPVERLYVEAFRQARRDSDIGLAKFQAIIDLYGSAGDSSSPTAQCVELARRRVAQLREQRDVQAQEHLALILDRLDEADRARPREPRRAEATYHAVLELYAGKAWAAAAVRRAQQALAATGSRAQNPNPQPQIPNHVKVPREQ
jgi:serine/threonine-protein kinase